MSATGAQQGIPLAWESGYQGWCRRASESVPAPGVFRSGVLARRSAVAGFCAAGLFSEGGFGCERRCRRGGVPARDRWRWFKAVALRGEGSVKRTRVDRLRGAVWVSLLRQQRLGHLPDPAQVARGPDPRESSVSEPVPADGREAFVCGATHRLGEGPPGPAGSWGHKPGAAGFYRTEGNRRLCRPNEARSAK